MKARLALALPAILVAAASPARAESRVVVFTDGGSPRLVAGGPRKVRGALELDLRFQNVSPLCYEYRTSVSASLAAAWRRGLPEAPPGVGALGAPSTKAFAGLEEAAFAVGTAESELEEVLNAARIHVSLDDVWASCDGGVDSAVQQAKVEAAASVAAERLGPSGTWRRILENAEGVALGAKRMARDLAAFEHAASQEVEARKAALLEAETEERRLRDAAARTGTTRKAEAELKEAGAALASAQRKLREADLKLARHRRAGELERTGERLSERVRLVLASLSESVAEINRARGLLASTPTSIRRRFGEGESVRVVVERTRLDRGLRVPGRSPERFEVPAYETLKPVILDIGIGPALGLGRNTEKYETKWSPAGRSNPTSTWRVVRTEQGLPLDAILSLGAYVWQQRYFDDKIVDPLQFMPRPMLAMSIAHPLDVLYAGLSVDPIQFLDVSFGARFANERTLVGPQPLDRALIDDEGDPQPPLTREQIRVSGFASVTVSANLLYSWIRQGL